METHHILAIAVSGIIAGFMNAIAGGGTILTFPTLLFVGMNSIEANATSTLALMVGIAGSVYGYKKQIPAIRPWLKHLTPVSVLGGVAGAVLLTLTPPAFFDKLVPFLILFATVLFLSQRFFAQKAAQAIFHTSATGEHKSPWGLIAFQFVIALYGGYFGAGIGILMLASLGFMGLQDIHQMNTLKTILAGWINLVAALYFIWQGLIHWPVAGILALGATAGYYGGSVFSQKISPALVRKLIGAIGLAIAVWLFIDRFF